MPRDDGLEWVRQARAHVEQARSMLALPTAATLDSTVPAFQEAAHAIGALKRALRSGTAANSRALETALVELRQEVGRAAARIENAAALRRGWAGLLYSAACGYTSRGEPAAPDPGRGVMVEG